GRLVGQEPFFFDKVAGWSDGEILSAFVRQFYGKAVAPAPEILLSEELPEAELTTEWLSTLAGRRVQVLAPQRGTKRQFVAVAEVLSRRFAKALEQGSVLPDLILIDGGRGQLNAALKVLQDLGLDYIPAVGLAKQAEEVYQADSLHPLVLDQTSPALHTLQRI